jgi:hypothetical protein
MITKVRGMGEPRRLVALGVAIMLVGGCSSTTTTQTVSSPIAERRTRVDADEPIVTSTWALEGSKITGHVSWASCVSQRSWTTEQQSTVRRRPIPVAGWGLLLGGGALVGVGLGTRDSSAPEPACPTDPVAYNEQMLYGPSCGHTPSNGSSNAEVLIGAIAMVAGLAVLSVSSSDQTQTLSSQPHAETATGPCISPADLATLSLVLKLGERQFVHVALESNGEAVIELPAHLPSSVRLAPGADLPIIVYRAPRSAAAILPRWQVVGNVHVPE